MISPTCQLNFIMNMSQLEIHKIEIKYYYTWVLRI